MNDKVLESYIKAGKIASDARNRSRDLVKPGKSLLEIAENIENFIRDSGGAVAFPINISLNNIGAHYTPVKDEILIIKDTDIVKIDIGVHVDGYIGDTAYTGFFDERYRELCDASRLALEAALELCRPGVKLSKISLVIEDTIKSLGFKPVSNLTGHGLERYNLHAEPQIPNVKFSGEYVIKEDQVLALEPFATDGMGMIKESDQVMIFMLIGKKPVRNSDARTVINFAKRFGGLPFSERWIPLDSRIKIRFALRELREKGILYDYPVLKEAGGGMISQFEHTVIVRDEPIITTL
jgi:methionyl aminopeptidase